MSSFKKHERCRRIADYVSIWTYSLGTPPKPINAIYLRWLNTGKVPSMRKIDGAITASERDRTPIAASHGERSEGW